MGNIKRHIQNILQYPQEIWIDLSFGFSIKFVRNSNFRGASVCRFCNNHNSNNGASTSCWQHAKHCQILLNTIKWKWSIFKIKLTNESFEVTAQWPQIHIYERLVSFKISNVALFPSLDVSSKRKQTNVQLSKHLRRYKHVKHTYNCALFAWNCLKFLTSIEHVMRWEAAGFESNPDSLNVIDFE